MIKNKILLIEDDELLGEALYEHLKVSYNCTWAQTIDKALELYQSNKFDVIISDFNVHGKSSLDFLLEISKLNNCPPFIVISGYVDKSVAIQFLNEGARFLIEKPFKLEELDLLLKKIFIPRNSGLLEEKELELLINVKAQSVQYQNNFIDLTPTEFKLITYFLVHRGEAISKKDIEKLLWGEEKVSRNLIYTHIGNLKKKIPAVNKLVQIKKGALFVEGPKI